MDGWLFFAFDLFLGYAYTQTEDRFWRKNRRVVNYTCTGIDLNRNYAYVWEDVPDSERFDEFSQDYVFSIELAF
jgi:Zinc carboxypeptidase